MITIEQICSLNLGKEIDYYRDYKVMIVGYNKRFNFIICSCTKMMVGLNDRFRYYSYSKSS